MKPTIKYLLNGEYHYATVKDIGDIEKLTTAVKTDLVSAINSISGGGGSIPPDLLQTIEDLERQLEEIVSGGLDDAMLREMQELMDASMEAMNADLQLKIDTLAKTYDDKFLEVTSDYDQKVLDIQGNVVGLRDDLETTEQSLKETGAKLSNVELNYATVTETVDTINGKMATKVESSDFELLESTVNVHETEIAQTKESISLMADKESLDLATGQITDMSAKLEIQAGQIASTVKKEELKQELEGLEIYAPNILEGTTDWNGWTAINPSNAYILSDTYQHTQIQEQLGFGAYEERNLNGLVVGKTYIASVWGKSTNIKAQPIFKINGVNNIMLNVNKDSFMGTEWQRFSVKFVASATSVKVSFTTISTVSGDKSHFAGGKVEIGTVNTGWRPNESDSHNRVVSAESSIRQQADQIISVVTEQEKIGEDVTKHTTSINQLSESIELQATGLSEIEGKVSANEASIKLNDNSIKLKVEQNDIDKSVEGIKLDIRNGVLNSDFQRDFTDWTSVNSAFKIVEISGKKYAKITRSGLLANTVAAITTNKMPAVKGDRLMIGFDMVVDDLSKYDVKTPAMLELFDISDVRVDFRELTMAELKGSLTNGKPGRLSTNYTISRDDVAKASLRLNLYRNGSVAYTNASLQKGDIGSTEWIPAPEDSQLIQASLKTEIDQNAEAITLKASSDTVNKLSGDLASNTASLKVANDAIAAHTQSLTKVDGKISEHEAKLVQTSTELSSKITSTEVNTLLDKKGYATQSELKQTSDGFELAVGSVREDAVNAIQKYDILNDKTEILSGNPIFTDKADDAVVHVEVDGLSIGGGSGKNLFRNIKTTDFPPTYQISVSTGIVENVDTPTGWALRLSNIVLNGSSPSIYFNPTNSIHYAEDFVGKPMTVSFFVRGSEPFKLSGTDIGTSWTRFTSYRSSWSSSNFHYNFDRNLDFVDISSIQIEHGSTATPYELPAPTPDYPIAINSLNNVDVVSSVGKENLVLTSDKLKVGGQASGISTSITSEGYYQVVATAGNSNYANNFMSASNVLTNELQDGDKFTISFTMKSPNSTGIPTIYLKPGMGYFEMLGTMSTEFSTIYYTGVWRTANNIVFHMGFSTLVGTFIIKNMKIEKGELTPYSLASEDITYNTQTPSIYKTNILLSEPLRSVGNVKDRLFLDTDGLWKVERNVGEYKADGSEDWTNRDSESAFPNIETRWFQLVLPNIAPIPAIGKTTHFAKITSGYLDEIHVRIANIANTLYIGVFPPKSMHTTLTDYKNWLTSQKNNGTPLTIQYILATPTIETLSTEQQTKLNGIQSFKGSNYVYTIEPDKSDILSPTLHATFKSSGWTSRSKIKDVTNSLDDLEDITLPALSDGLLNKSEKESIKQSLNIVESEKKGFDSQYNSVYANASLTGSQKTNLYNSKVAYNTAQSELKAAINAVLAVADGVRISNTLTAKVETEFNEYGIALATLSQRLQEALDAISGKKSADAEANAKAHTTAQLVIRDNMISSRVEKTDYTGAKVASLINQSADTVKIAAKNIDINGAVTFNSFDSGLKNDINAKATKVETMTGGGKIFKNPLSVSSSVPAITGCLVIRTPITSAYMTKISVSGYNYNSTTSNIDLDISFYAYTASQFANYSYTNKGSYPIDSVRLGRDSAGCAVIIIGTGNSTWSYPKVQVTEAIIGHSNPPDSYQNGWSVEYLGSLTAFTAVTDVSGADYKIDIGAAQSAADNAKASIADMSSDSKITPVEKVQLKKEWAAISAERASIDGLAATYGITTERTNMTNSYNTLNTVLNGTSGILVNMSTTSTVVGATFRGQFDDYYDKKAILQRKVNETAKTLANSAQNDASNAKGKTDNWTVTGTTEINGAKIRTGTLTADKITTGKMTNTKGNVTLDLDGGKMTMKDSTGSNTSTLTEGKLDFVYKGEFLPISSSLGNGSLSFTKEADVHPFTVKYGTEITFGVGEQYQTPTSMVLGRGSGFGLRADNHYKNVIDIGEYDSRNVGFPFGTGDAFLDTDYSSFQFLKPAGFKEGFVSNRIPASSNLNNYQNPGFYYCPSDADTKTISNTPGSNAFSLLVERHAGIKQTFSLYMTNNVSTWVRNYYSGSWGAWIKTIGEVNINSLSLQNGWGNFGGVYTFPQYWKDANNIVHVRGTIEGGANKAAGAIGVLPSGYRPTNREMFACYAYNGTTVRVDVEQNGTIRTSGTTQGHLSLAGIVFSID